MLLILLVVILVFGLGGGAYYGPRAGWGTPHYRNGGIGGLLLILLIIWLLFGR